MKPLFNSSYNYFFNSCSFIGAILYGVLEIGAILEASSILNSTYLLGANPERLSEKTSKNSYIFRVSFILKTTSYDLFTICAKYALHLLLIIIQALTLLIIILKTWHFLKVNYSLLSKLN